MQIISNIDLFAALLAQVQNILDDSRWCSVGLVVIGSVLQAIFFHDSIGAGGRPE